MSLMLEDDMMMAHALATCNEGGDRGDINSVCLQENENLTVGGRR